MSSGIPRLVASFLVIVLLASGSFVRAETILLPDRCPEPCEVGGTHVSDDYQRLTTPFRIRNGNSGKYLKVSGRGVSAQPFVENDDSFLWGAASPVRPCASTAAT